MRKVRRFVGAHVLTAVLVTGFPWFSLPQRQVTAESVIWGCPPGTHEVVVLGIIVGCWPD